MCGVVLILFPRMEHGHRSHSTPVILQLLKAPSELTSLNTVMLLEQSLEWLLPYITVNLTSRVLVSTANSISTALNAWYVPVYSIKSYLIRRL